MEVATQANGGCRRRCYIHGRRRCYIHPRFTAVAENFCWRCVHYQHHNVVKVFKQPEGAHPPPWGPFVYIQMDFVTMPKCCNFNHIMVMVDMFTKLIDAYLCRSCDARMVAKLLFKVYLCRYGIPYNISSDKGSHFTLHITKELWKASQIKQHFHCLYHPESAGHRLQGAHLQVKMVLVQVISFLMFLSTTLFFTDYNIQTHILL